MEKYSVSNLTKGDNLRARENLYYDASEGVIIADTKPSDGITIFNYQRQNPLSDIYVAKTAFTSSKRLFTVLGHEFVHSSHYGMNLWDSFVTRYGFEKGKELFFRFSEASAYSYSLVSSKLIGDTPAYINHIRGNLLANGGRMPKYMNWRNFGIPTKLK